MFITLSHSPIRLVHDTDDISQYRLGLQIDGLDGNRLCTTQETQHQNRELSAE